MKDFILESMKNGTNGLQTIEIPTGFGKSYNAAKACVELVRDESFDKKIIFLTTLNKNLPEEEFIKQFGSKEEYDKYVLRIRANVDEVMDNIDKVDIPSSKCPKSYKELKASVKRYKDVEGSKIKDKEYLDNLKEKVEENEKNFRKEIIKLLKSSNAKNKQAKKELIKTNKDYRWIGEIYPTVLTDDYKILMMSVSKFLKKNIVLVEPSYDFIKADFIDNSIIIIDEFDVTKPAILNEIIENACNLKLDYMQLFRHLNNALNKGNLAKDILEALDKTNNQKYNYEFIVKEGKEIEEDYHTSLSYKLIEDDKDNSRSFLYSDSTYHSILPNGKIYINAYKNRETNRIDIELTEKRKENSNKEKIVIYAMLRAIAKYLNHFRIFLYQWANNYMQVVNDKRDASRDMMTLDNAVQSILNKLGLSEKQVSLLDSEMNISNNKNVDSLLEDTTFYQKGLKYYELEDADHHNEDTNLNYISLNDTPEKILIYLANKAKIIGLSATAEIPTVIGNYDLGYLKEKLGDKFLTTPNILKEKVRNILENQWDPYRNGDINVKTEVFSSSLEDLEINEYCAKYVNNKELANILLNKINENIPSDLKEDKVNYFKCRYVNIIRSMYSFIMNKDISSMLYLGMALAKDNNFKMDKDKLKFFFNTILDYYEQPKENISIDFLSSDDFDKEKENILNKLSKGERVYVMSTYQTIGAGQNLQYGIPENLDVVYLGEFNDKDSRYKKKDFDAIYLGEITNLAVNLADENLSEEQLIKALVDVEELYENCEISIKEKNELIKKSFKAYAGSKEFTGNNVRDTKSIKLQATRNVIQAIGRTTRTLVKNPNVYLYIDSKLLNMLEANEIKKRIVSPEMNKILELLEDVPVEISDEQKKYLLEAEKASSEGQWIIKKLLSQNWTESSMQTWASLRELTLKYPTASKNEWETNPYIHRYYITNGDKLDRYLYSQYADFSRVAIDFGYDIDTFKKSGNALRDDNKDFIIFKVNEDESGLKPILNYLGMTNYFKDMGYKTEFDKNDYIMSPILFHNIYKGALGEAAGSFILEKELGIKLKEIKDPSKFEFFDFILADDVYVDFKNWKYNYIQSKEEVHEKILNKLDAINGKRAYIINIVADESFTPKSSIDERIIEIPALIDEKGKVNYKNLHMIKQEDIDNANK